MQTKSIKIYGTEKKKTCRNCFVTNMFDGKNEDINAVHILKP